MKYILHHKHGVIRHHHGVIRHHHMTGRGLLLRAGLGAPVSTSAYEPARRPTGLVAPILQKGSGRREKPKKFVFQM